MIKLRTLVIYSLLTAVLLSLPWLFLFPGWVLFVGFVPVLLLEHKLGINPDKGKSFRFLNYLLLTFFLWNLLSAWWLAYATFTGFCLFLLLNTFLMTSVWYIYHRFKIRVGERFALILLVVLWLTFEYLHLNWDIELPGMTLGATFGNQVKMVQWYEFTGVLGGSLWILLVNIVVFRLYKSYSATKKIVYSEAVIGLLLLLVPLVYSLARYYSYTEKGAKVEVAVVQPNIDPFTEKFGSAGFDWQLDRLLLLVDSVVTDSTKFVVCPETALAPFSEDSMSSNLDIAAFRLRTKICQTLNVITGATTRKLFTKDEKPSHTARQIKVSGLYYDEYNSALFITNGDSVQVYHKHILVSGVEKMPYSRYFNFLNRYVFDIGGPSGGMGVGQPANFITDDGYAISPVICFESMFGEYVGNLVKQGGELVFVITNDGWWKLSQGAKLHFSYSRLRAIETRRDVARSANTGISGLINQRGDVIAKTEWWWAYAIKADLHRNHKITFYTQHGDYLGRIAVFAVVFILMGWISQSGSKSGYFRKRIQDVSNI